MDTTKSTINAKIFEAEKFWLVFLSPVGVVFPLCVYLGNHYNLPIIRQGGFVFLITPFILIYKIKNICKKKVRVTFYDDHFLFEVFNLKSGIKIKQTEYFYNVIKWAKIISSSENYSGIVLKFLNGEKFKQVLLDEDKDDKQDDKLPCSSSELMYKVISSIKEKQDGIKVELRLSFLTSKSGLIFISILTIIIVIAVIDHLYYSPQSFIILIPSLIMYFGLLAKRKTNLATYNKLK